MYLILILLSSMRWWIGDMRAFIESRLPPTDLVHGKYYLSRHNTLCLYDKLPLLILNDPYINLLLLNDGDDFVNLRKFVFPQV